ncbi:MAG TPA: maleylpyruvate isomerase family mycothiol-dependent enzyme [Sporichthyaceae bacterium]|jgi:uncharacterized protein (TIGR03084 family)|nr:maleylpyruvate isomerase family mycothiol-dependent enzyme [Sporichthyaceae bacterium]
MDVITDLAAEYEALATVLTGLDDAQWQASSGAPGWTVADVILHLAQTNEAVVATCAGRSTRLGEGSSVDATVDAWVAAERTTGPDVLRRWRAGLEPSLAALRGADPDRRYPWAEAPLRPAVLATTRIAEHWAHGLDVAEPLGRPFPDTTRLRHIAWLAHRTLPYGLALRDLPAVAVRCELAAPDGTIWEFGPPGAPVRVSGSAGQFCRVAAQRLTPQAADLRTAGPGAEGVLSALRSYAA